MSAVLQLDRVNPLTFVTPDRLDLVVKMRLFLHLQDQTDPESVRVYLWHINARTGGVEPGGSKSSLAQYLKAARALHQSMRLEGFDRIYPVRVGSNGLLMDGAHRIGCALALRLPRIDVARLDVPGRARPWGEAFLRAGGIEPGDLEQIKSDFRAITGELI